MSIFLDKSRIIIIRYYNNINDLEPFQVIECKYDFDSIGEMFSCIRIIETASGLSNVYYAIKKENVLLLCDSVSRMHQCYYKK